MIGSGRVWVAMLAAAGALTARGPRAAAEPETLATSRWAAVDLIVGRIDPGTEPLTLFVLATRAGMLVTRDLGFGLRAGIVHARGDAESETALSNLTGDVYYTLFRGVGEWQPRLSVLGSLSAPTATGELASGAASLYWLPEPGLYHPDATTARASVLASGASGKASGEAELDFQHLFTGGSDDDASRLRLRARFGWKPSARIGLFGQLSTSWEADADAEQDRFLHWADAGLSIDGQGGGQARLSVYVPIDEVTRDTLGMVGGQLTFAGTF